MSDTHLTRLEQQFCHIIDPKGRVCGKSLDYRNVEIWPEGRCLTHCRAVQDDGLICTLPPMINGLCYKHGGREDQSIDKYLQSGITAQTRAAQLDGADKRIYEMAMSDPELHGHRSDLAVLEVRLHQLLAEQDQWKSEVLLEELKKEINRVSSALKKGWKKAHRSLTRTKPETNQAITALEDIEEFVSLEELRMLIMHASATYSTWREIDSLLLRRNQVATSERKRLLDSKKFVTGEQAMAVIEQVVGELQRVLFNYVEEATGKMIMREVSGRIREIVGYDES